MDVSPYLRLPLRTLEQARRDIEENQALYDRSRRRGELVEDRLAPAQPAE